jgi:hypothetical protein
MLYYAALSSETERLLELALNLNRTILNFCCIFIKFLALEFDKIVLHYLQYFFYLVLSNEQASSIVPSFLGSECKWYGTNVTAFAARF